MSPSPLILKHCDMYVHVHSAGPGGTGQSGGHNEKMQL